MVKQYITSLFEILNKQYNYAVLRNYDELPYDFSSKDIDLLITRKDFEVLKGDLFSLMNSYGFKIFLINENERFVQVMIMKLVDDKINFLHLDFFFNYSLYGVELVDTNEILKRRQFNGNVYHVNLMDEFIDKFLNTALLDHKYPAKYENILKAIERHHHAEVEDVLSGIFYDRNMNIEKCQDIPGKKLLLKVLFFNFLKKPIRQMKMSSLFIYFYIKGWVTPNGFSFSITGPDGSGKTTILTQLEKTYLKTYREIELNHFRPTVIPRLAELFKKSGLKKEVDVNYDQPHRGGKTSKISSWVRLVYYISDYIIGYYKIVKPALFRRSIVIFDRYYTDIISDGKRSRIYLNYKVVFMLRKLVPKMDYNFIIFVDPERILQRKQELTKEQIDEIYVKLNYICENDKNYIPVNNDNEPHQAVNAILKHILEQQDKKYQSFFK